MDFIRGVRLSTFLREPSDDEESLVVLDPDIDDDKLSVIYRQLADYILQLSQLEFPPIGAIPCSDSGVWVITGRPLTFDMDELVIGTGYPADQLPSAPFDSASNYFHSMADQRMLHLNTQRNLAKDEADVERRFIARHELRQLISRYCLHNDGPFSLFCDDLQPENMLIDPDTLRITAVLDFEFTNNMPAQYTRDLPWWLFLKGPDVWLDRNDLTGFLSRYTPKMDLFLRALKEVEDEKTTAIGQNSGESALSTQMRDSWISGSFWFNFVLRTSLDMDDVYWDASCDHVRDPSSGSLDEKLQLELAALTDRHKDAAAERLRD